MKDALFFVRIPKTGSTSVTEALCEGVTRIEESDHWAGETFFLNWERKLRTVQPKKYLTFTIVRNPFDWLTSAYYYNWKGAQCRGALSLEDRNPIAHISNKEVLEKMSVGCQNMLAQGIPDTHLGQLHPCCGARKINHITHTWEEFIHYWCTNPTYQSGWLNHQCNRSIYAQIYDEAGNCAVECVLRYERLQEGWPLLFDKIGKKAPELGWLNKTESKKLHYKEYYSPELIKLVEQKHAIELKLFGYDFDGPTDDRIFLNPAALKIEK